MLHCQSLKEFPEYRHLSKIALGIRLWVKDLTSLKELLTTTGTSDFSCVSENDVHVYKQISSLLNIDKCVLILRLFLSDSLENFTYMYWMNILKGYLWPKSFNIQVTSLEKMSLQYYISAPPRSTQHEQKAIRFILAV